MGGGGSKKTGYLSEKNLKAHEASVEIHQNVRQRLSAPTANAPPVPPPGKKDTGRKRGKRGKKESSPPSSPTYHAPKNMSPSAFSPPQLPPHTSFCTRTASSGALQLGGGEGLQKRATTHDRGPKRPHPPRL